MVAGMSAITDAREAIIGILKADGAVAALVGIRVFGDELPRSETDGREGTGRKAVVVSPGGGSPPSYTTATLPLEGARIDVFCYGETLYQAEVVRRTVYGALKGVQRVVQGDVLVHWVRPAGGAASGRDPNTNWPVKWNSWQYLADERAVA